MSAISTEELQSVHGGWLPRTDDVSGACRRDMLEASNVSAGLGIFAGGVPGGLTGALKTASTGRPLVFAAGTVVGTLVGAVGGFQVLQYGVAALEKRFSQNCRKRG